MHVRQRELSIIIADDDSTTRRVLRMLLREQGHEVVAEAPDGEKAVELCEAHKPDIAFLDIDMPGINGHEAARQIREALPRIGMIMISALPTLENVQNSLQTGASGFVVKPFTPVKVAEAIELCMRQRRG